MLTQQKGPSHYRADDATDDRAGHKIREPMDGHGHANANIKSVGDRDVSHPPLFRKKRLYRHGHGKGDHGVRGWPPPEDPAAQNAEPEDVGQI